MLLRYTLDDDLDIPPPEEDERPPY